VFAGLLNKGFRGSLLLLGAFFLVGWLLLFLAPRALEHEYYPNLFYNYLTHDLSSKVLITTLNLLITAAGTLLVSFIVANQEIVDKQNYFPVFLYLLLALASLNPYQVASQNLTNVFVLYSLYKLLDVYRRPDVLRQIFEAAFWLCCSAFITISTIISFPAFFVILLILRPFNWREWANAILGFMVPVFIYECVAYLSDFNQGYLFSAAGQYFKYLKAPSFSEYYFPVTACLFLLLIASFLYNMANGAGNTVKKQRSKLILIWLTLFSIPGFFSGGANSGIIILTFAIPLAFFIGDFLFRIRRIKITNTLLAILLLCVGVVFAGEFGLF
jgi:hypothetical protein